MKTGIHIYHEITNQEHLASRKQIGYSSILTFGKYKGQKVSEVMKRDKQYIEWIVQNLDRFSEKLCLELYKK